MPAKVFIFGLDGGSWKILNPLIKNGYLPFMESFMKAGYRGILWSVIPPLTPVAWSSFQTGVNPGIHGIYDFLSFNKEKHSLSIIDASYLSAPPLWKILTELGLSSVVINVPVTYPPQPIKGALISGLLSPKVSKKIVYPEELYSKYQTIFQDYNIIISRWEASSLDLDEFVREQTKVEERRFNLAKKVLKEYDWDFAMLHIQSSDYIQHRFWHLLDEKSPDFNSEAFETVGRFYKTIDRLMGKLSLEFDNNTVTFIMSDHGFGLSRFEVYLNEWLKKNGILQLETETTFFPYLEKTAKRVILSDIGRRTIGRLLGHLATHRLSQRRTSNILKMVNWEKTKALMLSSVHYGNVYLNPDCKTHLNEDEVVQIIESLRINGQRVIKRVYKRDELFHGPRVHLAPDYVVEPEDGFVLHQGIGYGRLYRLCKPGSDNTGTHRLDGIYMLKGRTIPTGYADASILDIAPSVLKILEVTPPKYMDGKILQALKDSSYSTKPPKYKLSDDYEKKITDESVYIEEEKKMLEKRLEDLGYI